METTWFKCPKNKTKRKMCSSVLFWQPHRLLSVSCTTCYSLFSSSSLSDMLDHPSPFSPPLNPLWLVCSQDKEQGWRERGAEEKEREGRGCVCTCQGAVFPPSTSAVLAVLSSSKVASDWKWSTEETFSSSKNTITMTSHYQTSKCTQLSFSISDDLQMQ